MESPSPAPDLKSVIEALLFAAGRPLTPRELRELLAQAAADDDAPPPAAALKKTKEDAVTAALEELAAEHAAAGRSWRLACVAGAWQFLTRPEHAPWLRALAGRKARPPRLSQPALETLTIIAYRQPVTRAEMEQVRGVAVDGVLQTLVERGLVEAVGRAEVVGRPVTYGTTAAFLEYFGLRSLEELPAADELRRLPVEKPEALHTLDPGLATAPPAELAAADAAAAPPEASEAPGAPRTPPPLP